MFGLFLGLNTVNGQFWQKKWTGFATVSRGISDVFIADSNLAWAIAYDGANTSNKIHEITKTTDGGNTWTASTVNLTGTVNPGLSMICSTDANTAYIAAYKNSIGKAGIWKTTDGGTSWTLQTNAANNMYTNSASFPNVVYFFDANNGFCQGDPINGEFEIYTTSDAGATWTLVGGANIDNPNANEFGYVHGYAVAGNSIWFTTATGRLYKSSDMGHTWTAYQTPIPDFGGVNVSGTSGSITFKDNNEGWALKNDKTLYHTTDGGANWTQLTTTGDILGGDISFVPGTANTLYTSSGASADKGTSVSTDGGLTWTRKDAVQHIGVYFYNEYIGYSGGFSKQSTGDGMYVHRDLSGIVDNGMIKMSVFPNPADNIVNVLTDTAIIQSINVYDITGKQVINLNGIDAQNARIDVSNLRRGLYLLEVIDNANAKQSVKLSVK